MSKGVNSSAPTTGEIIAGVYNVTPPVLVDGQAAALQVDVNGQLKTAGGGSGGGNVNITGINGTPPALSNPLPVELSDGTNPVGTASNPLSVNVITGGGSNASVGATGVAAPASATEIGIVDGTGKLQNVSTTNPVPENQTQIASVAIATAAAGVQKVGIVGATGTALDGTPGILDENVKNWGGIAVTAPPASGVPAVGTEVAPVVKSIQRKNAVVVTTTAPAINTTTYYPGAVTVPTSANWFDAGAVGSVLISLTAYNNPASPNNLIAVEQADDPADTAVTANSCVPLANQSGTNGVNYSLTASVTKRYWRIRYVNGPTASGTAFKISFTEQSIPAAPLLSTSNGTVAGGGPAGATPSGFGNSVGPIYISAANPSGAIFTGPLGVITYKYTPVSGAMAIDRQVETFKTASIAATSTTTASNPIWTPAAGKKFRLMRFQITAQGLSATASGVVTVSFVDSASGITIGTYDVDVPAVANVVSGVNNISCGWVDLGNGFLSAVANNVLNFGISAAGAGTTGTYRINVCGTEE